MTERLPAFAFDARWRRATVLFLIVTTVFRLVQLPGMELAPDEAYYWDWSRRLSLGYYDQGPMIAYVIRLTTALFGTNEFGVRFGVLAASLGTLLCCYTLAVRFFSPMTGFLTVLFLGVTPLMEVGSLIATYDPLLVCFWALALVFLERALFATEEKTQRISWLKAGIATGFGFLSKHTMLLILPCLLLFLALSPMHRRWLRRPEPYLAFLITLLLYSGVFWWNAHHHWWTFGHLLFLTKKTFDSPVRRFGDFLGSQAALLGPSLFLGALLACWRVILAPAPRNRREETSPQPLSLARRGAKAVGAITTAGQPETAGFLVCMGLPIFVIFCLMTFKAKVQGNWAPCAWLTPTILLAGWLTEQAGQSGQGLRATCRWTGVVVGLSGFLTLVLISPWLRWKLGVRLPPDADISNQAYGWRETAARVQQVRQEMARQGRTVFLTSNGYQYCALLAFYLPDHPETFDLFLHFRLTMYAASVERLKSHLGEDALFINENVGDEGDLRQLFTRVTWDPPIPIWRRPYYSQPIRVMHIARCTRYQRYIGLEWARGG